MKTKHNAVKNTIWLGAAAVATSALTLSAMAAPQMQPMKDMPNVMTVSPAQIERGVAANFDRLFLIHASQGNLAEVMFGKLALQKSKNPGVRTVADTIIMGHGMAQKQLAPLLKANGLPVPTMLAPADKAVYDQLKMMSGAAFDKAFIGGQVGAHEATVTLFEHEKHMGMKAAEKNIAIKQLPGILQHTALIYKVAKEVAAPGIEKRPASFTTLGTYKPAPMKDGMMGGSMMMKK